MCNTASAYVFFLLYYLLAHSSAQPQERPTATVSPLRTQNSPSRLPASPNRLQSNVSPQHMHQQQQASVQTSPAIHCARAIIPLTSAAAAITPPNVTAANINGDAVNGQVNCLPTGSPSNTGCKADERKTEKVSLFLIDGYNNTLYKVLYIVHCTKEDPV